MIDNSEYLQDISPDKPCGEYLKYDPIYDQIKEEKREDDPRLPQGVWQIEIKKANWKAVIDLCTDVLKNKSKDLQIAAWLVEAYISVYHWEGMYDSLNLFYDLCEKYWDSIYPVIEDDDFDYRLSPIVSLTTRLVDLSMLIDITNPDDNIHKNYSLSSWIEARYYAKSDKGRNTFNELNESLSLTADMFLINNEHWIQKAKLVIEKLNSFLNAKTNEQSPSFSHVLENLKDADTIISNVLSERGVKKWAPEDDAYTAESEEEKVEEETDQEAVDEESAAYSSSEASTETKGGGDPLEKATLAQAFNALYQILNFIEQKDPHNPVSILIKLALHLHDKSFADLIGMTTKDGEPVVTCLSKLCSVFETKKFDKSIFDEENQTQQ